MGTARIVWQQCVGAGELHEAMNPFTRPRRLAVTAPCFSGEVTGPLDATALALAHPLCQCYLPDRAGGLWAIELSAGKMRGQWRVPVFLWRQRAARDVLSIGSGQGILRQMFVLVWESRVNKVKSARR